MLTRSPENQSPGPNSQISPALRQLQLQSDRAIAPGHDVLHLQRYKAPSSSQQPAPVGGRYEPVATDPAVGPGLYFPRHLPDSVLRLLERRPQTRGEGCGLLHCLFCVLLRLQRCHVGCGSGDLPEQQGLWQRSGSVGLVL